MKLSNIFEAFCALPSIILDKIVSGIQDIWNQEKELARNGEFDPEEEEQNLA